MKSLGKPWEVAREVLGSLRKCSGALGRVRNFSELSQQCFENVMGCNTECQMVFKTLKKAFTLALVLTHWILDTPIMVETDASDYVLAAILSI